VNKKASSNAYDDPEGSTVASLLRNYRLAARLSQAELAERANVSVAAIGSLEQGLRKSPYPVTLHGIADALGLTPDERKTLIRSARRPREHHQATEPRSMFRANMPVPLTSFVERFETIELERLVSQHRLITVTGTAGVGKTRTVLQVAGQYTSSDVTFIDLSSITDDDLVAAQLASTMGLKTVKTSAIVSALISRIGNHPLLIVLDCCERVLDGVSVSVLALLRSCPNLRFVATSREPLGLSNEIIFRLPSLDASAALELFVTRAFAADARKTITDDDMNAAAEICRRLDGIPLAIELAAARAPLLGMSGLREHFSVLDFDSAAKDVPARHHTMTSAIEWSFSLLNDRERRVMRRLSIFVTSFALEGAEAVCADDDMPHEAIAPIIFDLVRKSLVEIKVAKPSNRYYVLDSVRTYAALELAAAGEEEPVAQRLATWFLDFVRTCTDLQGLASVSAMLPDLDNIRAVIEAQVRDRSPEKVAIAAELAGSYRHLWIATNRLVELRQLCMTVKRLLDEAAYPNEAALLANALVGTMGSAILRTDFLEAAIEANAKINDFRAVAAHLANLAARLTYLDHKDEALKCALRAEEALQHVSQSSRVQHYVRAYLAVVFLRTGDIPRARRAIAELDEIKAREQTSNDADYVLLRAETVAEIDFVAGDYASASAICRETMLRLASAPSGHPAWRELRLSLIGSELMLDRTESAAEECFKLVVDRCTYVHDDLEDTDAELVETAALVAGQRGLLKTAAQLVAWSNQAWKRLGLTRPPRYARIAEQAHRLLDHALAEDERRRSRDAGERMTAADALQLAAAASAAEAPEGPDL